MASARAKSAEVVGRPWCVWSGGGAGRHLRGPRPGLAVFIFQQQGDGGQVGPRGKARGQARWDCSRASRVEAMRDAQVARTASARISFPMRPRIQAGRFQWCSRAILACRWRFCWFPPRRRRRFQAPASGSSSSGMPGGDALAGVDRAMSVSANWRWMPAASRLVSTSTMVCVDPPTMTRRPRASLAVPVADCVALAGGEGAQGFGGHAAMAGVPSGTAGRWIGDGALAGKPCQRRTIKSTYFVTNPSDARCSRAFPRRSAWFHCRRSGPTITAPCGAKFLMPSDQLDREASLVAFVVRADVADLPEILQVEPVRFLLILNLPCTAQKTNSKMRTGLFVFAARGVSSPFPKTIGPVGCPVWQRG